MSKWHPVTCAVFLSFKMYFLKNCYCLTNQTSLFVQPLRTSSTFFKKYFVFCRSKSVWIPDSEPFGFRISNQIWIPDSNNQILLDSRFLILLPALKGWDEKTQEWYVFTMMDQFNDWKSFAKLRTIIVWSCQESDKIYI